MGGMNSRDAIRYTPLWRATRLLQEYHGDEELAKAISAILGPYSLVKNQPISATIEALRSTYGVDAVMSHMDATQWVIERHTISSVVEALRKIRGLDEVVSNLGATHEIIKQYSISAVGDALRETHGVDAVMSNLCTTQEVVEHNSVSAIVGALRKVHGIDAVISNLNATEEVIKHNTLPTIMHQIGQQHSLTDIFAEVLILTIRSVSSVILVGVGFFLLVSTLTVLIIGAIFFWHRAIYKARAYLNRRQGLVDGTPMLNINEACLPRDEINEGTSSRL